jgi:hypothetical protein
MQRQAIAIFVFAALTLGGCSSPKESSSLTMTTSSAEPGLLTRVWETTERLNPLKGELKPREMKVRGELNLKVLETSFSVDPVAPKLSEQRQITATLRLANKSKKLAQLDFPTSQRIEAVIKDQAGRILERWSDDQRFIDEPGLVAINPGERLEYSISLATREMKGGETYTVEAWFPKFETLRGSAAVSPIP